MSKHLISLIIFCLILSAGLTNAENENSQLQDLGVNVPKLLPGDSFYFIKNWSRTIKSALTFNSVAKIELKQKFASERLAEIEMLAEKTENSELIKRAVEKYQEEIGKMEKQAEKIRNKAKNNPALNKFLDKFSKQQVIHQRILQKLESQVPSEVLEKIKETRMQHLEKFGQIMEKLEDRIDKKIESLENLRSELKEEPPLKEKLLKARDKFLKEIAEEGCPAFLAPEPNFCKDGRLLIEKDPSSGCAIDAKCLVPGEFALPSARSCITLWDPVCGKNEKTYSNSCFAELAEAEIDYSGICQKKELPQAKEKPIKKSFANNISIENFAFNPPEIYVKRGETVTFTNNDKIPYNVFWQDEIIIPDIVPGQTWSYGVPKEPKIIEYFCSLYPDMKGKIIVEE
ncbi:MAG: DUF5667 domain-containing protein [bacterium]